MSIVSRELMEIKATAYWEFVTNELARKREALLRALADVSDMAAVYRLQGQITAINDVIKILELKTYKTTED